MRISKYPCIAGVGFDFHLATPAPPATPPVPFPAHPWLATISNPASALIYGKYTSQCSSEALWDILFGHDWGIVQPHFCMPPYTATPSTPLVLFGASHKFFLPAFSVKETPTGGALSLIGAGPTPVAISTPAFMITIQDCIDVGGAGIGLVAPVGTSFQLVSVRWVSFTLGDLLAGLVAMAGDAVVGAFSSKLGGALSNGMGRAGQAAVGAAINVTTGAATNAISGTDASQQGPLGAAAFFTPGVSGVGIGVFAGMAANAVGESGAASVVLDAPPPGVVTAGPDGTPIYP